MGCLTTVAKDSILSSLPSGRYVDAFNMEVGKYWRYLTPLEYERIQTLPDGYTEGYNDSTRKAMIGNSWTVDMIAHIFSFMWRIKYLPEHDTIMVNQRELLIKHFESRTSISGVEAANIYKIRSLPRRILDLKEMGYEFESQWRTDPTGQRYKRYPLLSKPNHIND